MIPPYENSEERLRDYEAYVKGLELGNKTADTVNMTRVINLVLRVAFGCTAMVWIFDAPVPHIDRWFFTTAVATVLSSLSVIDGELASIGMQNGSIERLLRMLVKSRPREKDRNAA